MDYLSVNFLFFCIYIIPIYVTRKITEPHCIKNSCGNPAVILFNMLFINTQITISKAKLKQQN